MDDILELLRERHSTRAYSGQLVSDEQLLKILEAGRLAPSARNTQPWKLYATNKQKLISELGASFERIGRNLFVGDCGAVVAITEEPLPEGIAMKRRYAEYDIGMCIMQICLEAHSIGVASCILGTYDEADVKRVFDIPDDRSVAMVICLGTSAEPEPRPKNRKAVTETFVIR